MHQNTSGSLCNYYKKCIHAENMWDSSAQYVLWTYECWQENVLSTCGDRYFTTKNILFSLSPCIKPYILFFLPQGFIVSYSSSMSYWYHKQVHSRMVNSKNRSRNRICELPFQFHVTLCCFPTFLVCKCHIKLAYSAILDAVRDTKVMKSLPGCTGCTTCTQDRAMWDNFLPLQA